MRRPRFTNYNHEPLDTLRRYHDLLHVTDAHTAHAGGAINALVGRPCNRYQFDSMMEWAQVVDRHAFPSILEQACTTVVGGENIVATGRELVDRALRGGWAEAAAGIEEYRDKFKAEIDTQSLETVIEQAVVGGVPAVPAFLAGSPAAMLAPVQVEGLSRPLRLVVDMSCSGTINDRTLVERGCAVAALLEVLVQSGHPVEAWVQCQCSDGRGSDGASCVQIRIPTAPFDYGVIGLMLCTPLMARVGGFGWAEATHGWEGSWAYNAHHSCGNGAAVDIAVSSIPVDGYDPASDIVVPALRSTSAGSDLASRNPVGYIRACLAQVGIEV